MDAPQSPRARALSAQSSMQEQNSSSISAFSSNPDSPSARFALGRSLASLPRSGHRDGSIPEADAAASHAVGEGLRCQVLHRPARFSIFACDRFRRHLRTGGDPFTVSIRGPSLVWPSLHDCEDGTYECEWQASVSGTYLVTVLLNGEHIAGSPWPARAIAPGADPSQCRLRAGSAPVHAIAGGAAFFDVEFFDALGEGVAMEPLELQAVLRSAEACAVRVAPGHKKKQTGGADGGDDAADRVYLLINAQETPETYPERKCRASVTMEKAGEYRLLHCHARTALALRVRLRRLLRVDQQIDAVGGVVATICPPSLLLLVSRCDAHGARLGSPQHGLKLQRLHRHALAQRVEKLHIEARSAARDRVHRGAPGAETALGRIGSWCDGASRPRTAGDVLAMEKNRH